MSDKSNQQISQLMDGELDLNASQFLLKRMATDETLKKTWNKYHLIKSCLQKDSKAPLVVDIASRVSAELGMINQPSPMIQSKFNKWIKPVMGIGIAASVAMMSIFILQNQSIEGSNPNEQTSIAITSTVKPIKTNISANVATSGEAFVPPPSLSRFPSVSAKNSSNYSSGIKQNKELPYLILINPSKKNHHLSPMRIDKVSD